MSRGDLGPRWPVVCWQKLHFESLLGEELWAGCQQWNLPQILCFLPPLLSPGSILVLLTYLALLGCKLDRKPDLPASRPTPSRGGLGDWGGGVSDSQWGGS